ncbi:MAG: hypothetical protein GW761_12440, partial [Leptospira sp.]|nr:hypothetical protein [Leptospira sp.]
RKYTITPIANSYELFLWGREFNNCAYTYLSEILEGEYYFYILSGKNNEQYMLSVCCVTEELAESGYYELALDRCYKSPTSSETQNIIWQLQEVKGIGNAEPPDYVWKYIDQWFEFVR